MSYSTRRSTGYAGASPQPQQQTVGNIGQRRPVAAQPASNFVSGGQLTPQAKPGVQVPPQQRPVQAPVQQQAAAPATPRNQQPAQTTYPPAQQQQPPPTAMKNEAPESENTNGENMDTSTDEGQKKRPFWNKSGYKISKKEKMRRRNVRLSKMLQPKNAVMILNELIKNTSYMVDDLPVKTDENEFKATVLVEGVEHVGFGKTKIHAKNSAAETALKHIIKYNKLTEMKKDDEGNEKMDVAEDAAEPPLPWQHVASFAIFKLFSSWGEDPNAVKSQLLNTSGGGGGGGSEKQHENKPAKKMPDNPETLNPLMLLNQMMPHARFEEIGKSGVPPNITYSYRCTVDGQSFIGTGSNKKAAKKLAAFGACHKLLDVQYSPDVYVPIF